MRRDDGLVRLHHVPRERALEPSVGLGDEAAPRAAQERCQGWGGLGGRHFLLSISTRVEFFFFSSSCFDFLRQGQRRAALALSLFSLFFFLFSFLFSLFPSPSNSSSLPPWPPCRGPHRVDGRRRACRRTHQRGPPRPRLLRDRDADVDDAVEEDRIWLFFPARPPRSCCLGPLRLLLLFGGTPHLFCRYAVSDCWAQLAR